MIKIESIKEEVEQLKNSCSTTSRSSKLELPDELPSVEEALKTLAAALKALETPRLEESDVLRLPSIISGTKVYKELLADF